MLPIPTRPAALGEIFLPELWWALGPGQAHGELLPQAFSMISICLLACSRLSKGRIRRLRFSCWEGWRSLLAELSSLCHSVTRARVLTLRAWCCPADGARSPGCRAGPCAAPLPPPAKNRTRCCCSLHAACAAAAAVSHGLLSAAQRAQNDACVFKKTMCFLL